MKSNMNSALLALLGFSFFLLGTQAMAQPDRPKNIKKRIIIETTVDENGTEHTERIEQILPDDAPADQLMQDLPADIQQELKKLGIDLNQIADNPNYNGNNNDLKILRWTDDNDSQLPPPLMQGFHIPPHDMGNIEELFMEQADSPNRTWLGVQLTDDETANGVRIEAITPDSPAEKAGLQKGDIITAFDKKQVTTSDQIIDQVNQLKPGDKITIEIKRNGKKDTIKATLAERKTPQKQIRERQLHFNNDAPTAMTPPKVILGIFPNTDQPTDTKGVLVSQVVDDSPAKQAGLQEGDIITQIDKQTINSFDELRNQIASHQVGDVVTVTFTRQGKTQTAQATLAAPKQIQKEIRIFDNAPQAPHCNPTWKNDPQAPHHPRQNTKKQVFIIQKTDGQTPSQQNKNKQGTTQLIVEDDRSIILSPNPNDGSFRLQYTTTNTQPVTIIVTDLSGKEALRRTFNDFKGTLNERFDIGLAQGTYLLQIEQDGKTTSERFIVK